MFSPTTKLLIVDDMLTMRKLVGKVCKELGFTDLKEAADGVKAWEEISTASPPFGLVISDWNMPNCTGLDLLKRVRSDSRFKTLPFLMVTAEAEPHQVAEAMKAGVDNYVIKPFDKDTLKAKLEAIYKKVANAA
jgi:two-component system chemotaxis response regulator CheY